MKGDFDSLHAFLEASQTATINNTGILQVCEAVTKGSYVWWLGNDHWYPAARTKKDIFSIQSDLQTSKRQNIWLPRNSELI